MTGQALDFLFSDPVTYADMLVPLRRGSGEVIAADGHGVLLLEHASGAHMLAAASDQTAYRLLRQLRKPALLCIHGRSVAEDAALHFGMDMTLICHQAVWMEDAPPRLPGLPFEVRLLDRAFAPMVAELYSHDIGLDYITARLGQGEMWGAFEGDTLAGFIGLHAEGSMGMLEVLPAYRRRGVGRLLAAFLIGEVLGRGGTPFSQFTVDNRASQALNRALGMTFSHETICWLERQAKPEPEPAVFL